MLESRLVSSLFEDFHKPLLLYVRQWLRGGLCDEVVQDVFLSLMKQEVLPRNVKGWLYLSVRNRAFDLLRAKRARDKYEVEAVKGKRKWFVEFKGAGMDAEMLEERLKNLGEEMREVVVMKIWGGLSFTDIGEVMGVSRSGVYRFYQAGIRSLRTGVVDGGSGKAGAVEMVMNMKRQAEHE